MSFPQESAHKAGVNLRLNGETHSTQAPNLSLLLEELGLKNRPVAVELNRTIIAKEDYETTALSAGDSLEIIQFVGGG